MVDCTPGESQEHFLVVDTPDLGKGRDMDRREVVFPDKYVGTCFRWMLGYSIRVDGCFSSLYVEIQVTLLQRP